LKLREAKLFVIGRAVHTMVSWDLTANWSEPIARFFLLPISHSLALILHPAFLNPLSVKPDLVETFVS
jgi:hypothetical protein